MLSVRPPPLPAWRCRLPRGFPFSERLRWFSSKAEPPPLYFFLQPDAENASFCVPSSCVGCVQRSSSPRRENKTFSCPSANIYVDPPLVPPPNLLRAVCESVFPLLHWIQRRDGEMYCYSALKCFFLCLIKQFTLCSHEKHYK